MKKKFKGMLLLIATLLPITMLGQTNFTYTANGVTWKCTGGSSFATILGETLGAANFTGVLNIPSTVSDGTNIYTVTYIAAGAFENYTGATKLILPEGLVSIFDAAFRNCSGLKGELKIPGGVTVIYNYNGNEFEGCTGVEYVTWNLKNKTGVGPRNHHSPMLGMTNLRYIDFRGSVMGVTSYGWTKQRGNFSPYGGASNHTLVYLSDNTGGVLTDFTLSEDNIIYKSKCKVFKVYDAYSYRIPYAFTAETAQCDRVFSNTSGKSVSTLFLPYPTDLPNGMQAYELVKKDLSIGTSKAFYFRALPTGTRLEANKPYLVRITDGATHTLPVMTNVEVPVSPAGYTTETLATDDGDWAFCGTTERIDNAAATAKKAYYLSGNKWYPVQNGMANDYIAPFRCFVYSKSGTAPAKGFTMVFDNESGTTDIRQLENDTETDLKSNTHRIYTLDGRYVGTDYNALPGGEMYIINGKKFYKF